MSNKELIDSRKPAGADQAPPGDSGASGQSPSDLLTLAEVAAYFPGRQVSTCTLTRWWRRGVGPRRVRLPVIAIGRKRLVRRADLEAFIDRLAEESNPPASPASAPTPARRPAQTPTQAERAAAVREALRTRHGI